MKKALKIVAWIVGGLLVFLLLAIILIPVVFKKCLDRISMYLYTYEFNFLFSIIKDNLSQDERKKIRSKNAMRNNTRKNN